MSQKIIHTYIYTQLYFLLCAQVCSPRGRSLVSVGMGDSVLGLSGIPRTTAEVPWLSCKELNDGANVLGKNCNVYENVV